jgi:hypothetical protein
MCKGIAIWCDQLPPGFVERHHLRRKVHDLDGRQQVRFLYGDHERVLPVRSKGQLLLVRWGCRRGDSRVLPCTGWTWRKTVEGGGWKDVGVKEVVIPATQYLGGDIWFGGRQGVRGVLARDERGRDVVYMVCEPARKDYETMTGSRWMPVRVGEAA